jgi:hypothetical protein
MTEEKRYKDINILNTKKFLTTKDIWTFRQLKNKTEKGKRIVSTLTLKIRRTINHRKNLNQERLVLKEGRESVKWEEGDKVKI